MLTIQHTALWSALAVAAGGLFAGSAVAHGGGLNAEGCHHDRKNGGYHCHRGAPTPAPVRESFAPPTASRQQLSRDSGDSAYYANCSAARAAGAAPVRRGDPGYGRHLDRDGDGTACE